MKTIENVIREAKHELEKSNQSTKIVGNRPHYPMLILYNTAFEKDDFESISSKMARVWPQSLKYLVNYRFTIDNQGVTCFDFLESAPKTKTEILNDIDNAKKAREVFQSMQQWYVYNILDTSTFRNVEDFIEHYNATTFIKDTLSDAHKNMLIVLLDDSSNSRTTAKAIREYLSKNSAYDSTIIISNRTRNNEMYDMKDLYRIVANILILSNNDSVSSVDDDDFKRRTSVLFSKTPYIVSYILRERPNKKIAIQILNTILSDINFKTKNPIELQASNWIKRLNFANSNSKICEDFLKKIELSVETKAFSHLPMNSNALNLKEDISQLTYRNTRQYIYDDVFNGFVSNYCKYQLSQDIDISQCIDDFRFEVLKEFSSVELSQLTDEIIDKIVSQLNVGTLNEDLNLSEYFKRSIQIHIRKNYIYPEFKRTLLELKKEAKEVLEQIQQLHSSFQSYIPLTMFDDIGTIYSNITSLFLQTGKGEVCANKILCAENNASDMLDEVLNTLKCILEENKDLFSLPFIEEWEKRLDLTGDRIYREISTALTENADDMIRLYGNCPIDKKLKVFMLHTYDANGKNPTTLYEHLQHTFLDDELVQYFNTGYDDALEALTFIACSDNNLII